MSRQIDAVVADFEAARARVRRLAARTREDRWATRRDPARWSPAECIAHLNATSRAYIPLLREGLDGHPPLVPPPRGYRRGFIGWLVGRAVGPLPRLGALRFGRVRTTPAFAPSGELDQATLIADFERLQDEQVALARDADGRPLEAIRIVSPFDARLGYNAFACLALLPRHQHRHLDQAEAVWAPRRLSGTHEQLKYERSHDD